MIQDTHQPIQACPETPTTGKRRATFSPSSVEEDGGGRDDDEEDSKPSLVTSSALIGSYPGQEVAKAEATTSK
jgi:hypothetical protein